MKNRFSILLLILLTACIPYKFAPKIKENHIQPAIDFHKKLPRENAYILKDPKDAGAFYDYLFYKLNPDPNLHPDDFPYNLPVDLYGTSAFLTFYEVEHTANTLNLFPFILDVALQVYDQDPILEESYTSRTGHWYLVMILKDDCMEDMLNPQHQRYNEAKDFLSALKKEYLATTDYESLLLTKK